MNDDLLLFLFSRWYLKPIVTFMTTQDRCLVLQQALNLESQIRLLGAFAPNTPLFRRRDKTMKEVIYVWKN
jgi:hypothetical protein